MDRVENIVTKISTQIIKLMLTYHVQKTVDQPIQELILKFLAKASSMVSSFLFKNSETEKFAKDQVVEGIKIIITEYLEIHEKSGCHCYDSLKDSSMDETLHYHLVQSCLFSFSSIGDVTRIKAIIQTALVHIINVILIIEDEPNSEQVVSEVKVFLKKTMNMMLTFASQKEANYVNKVIIWAIHDYFKIMRSTKCCCLGKNCTKTNILLIHHITRSMMFKF